MKNADPLYFLKCEIKTEIEKACGNPLSKRHLADRVGGRTRTALRAIDELLDTHELHQESRGIRFPLPGDPGYAEAS